MNQTTFYSGTENLNRIFNSLELNDTKNENTSCSKNITEGPIIQFIDTTNINLFHWKNFNNLLEFASLIDNNTDDTSSNSLKNSSINSFSNVSDNRSDSNISSQSETSIINRNKHFEYEMVNNTNKIIDKHKNNISNLSLLNEILVYSKPISNNICNLFSIEYRCLFSTYEKFTNKFKILRNGNCVSLYLKNDSKQKFTFLFYLGDLKNVTLKNSQLLHIGNNFLFVYMR